MGKASAIEWTDATFNVVWGCQKVSPGCEHCYALTWAKRMGFDVWGPAKTTGRRVLSDQYWSQPAKWNAEAEREGRRWRVFCSSMADVFEDHPITRAQLMRLWPIIRATPWLDWLLLTKRPENIAANVPGDWGPTGYANVWLGTSVESQQYAEERIPPLLAVPAAVRFLSLEPLLAPVDLTKLRDDELGANWNALTMGIDWCIIGGESGHNARPFDVGWARSLIEQCASTDARVFVKQLGGAPFEMGEVAGDVDAYPIHLVDSKGGEMAEWPGDIRIRQFPVQPNRQAIL